MNTDFGLLLTAGGLLSMTVFMASGFASAMRPE
jgi:hypothetical protein